MKPERKQALQELKIIIDGLAEDALTRHNLCVIMEENSPFLILTPITLKTEIIATFNPFKDGVWVISEYIKTVLDLSNPSLDINTMIDKIYDKFINEEKRRINRLKQF